MFLEKVFVSSLGGIHNFSIMYSHVAVLGLSVIMGYVI